MATVLPKLLRDFRARELSKVIPPLSQQPAGNSKTHLSTAQAQDGQVRLSNPFLPWLNPKTGRWAPPLYSRRRQKELVKAARSVGLETLVTGVAALDVDVSNVHRDTAGQASSSALGVDALGLLPPGLKCGIAQIEAGKYRWATARRLSSVPGPTEESFEASEGNTQAEKSMSKISTSVSLSSYLRSGKHKLAGYPELIDVQWVGRLKERPVDESGGAAAVSRLYTNKKRMFKGHKWERELASRKRMIAVRVRDMKERVTRFKDHYRKRRPNPLRPALTKKKESLPY